jgi:hypothetical protein
MSTSLSPASHDFGSIRVGQASNSQFAVIGHNFTNGEVSIDGQDRASFSAVKAGQSIDVTFAPVNRGAKVARLKVFIESDGPPYWISSSLQGTGA